MAPQSKRCKLVSPKIDQPVHSPRCLSPGMMRKCSQWELSPELSVTYGSRQGINNFRTRFMMSFRSLKKKKKSSQWVLVRLEVYSLVCARAVPPWWNFNAHFQFFSNSHRSQSQCWSMENWGGGNWISWKNSCLIHWISWK